MNLTALASKRQVQVFKLFKEFKYDNRIIFESCVGPSGGGLYVADGRVLQG